MYHPMFIKLKWCIRCFWVWGIPNASSDPKLVYNTQGQIPDTLEMEICINCNERPKPRVFERKPLLVHAWYYMESKWVAETFPVWMDHLENNWPNSISIDPRIPEEKIIVKRTDGTMVTAHPGDWIARGADGAVHVYSHDVFNSLYNPVKEKKS